MNYKLFLLYLFLLFPVLKVTSVPVEDLNIRLATELTGIDVAEKRLFQKYFPDDYPTLESVVKSGAINNKEDWVILSKRAAAGGDFYAFKVMSKFFTPEYYKTEILNLNKEVLIRKMLDVFLNGSTDAIQKMKSLMPKELFNAVLKDNFIKIISEADPKIIYDLFLNDDIPLSKENFGTVLKLNRFDLIASAVTALQDKIKVQVDVLKKTPETSPVLKTYMAQLDSIKEIPIVKEFLSNKEAFYSKAIAQAIKNNDFRAFEYLSKNTPNSVYRNLDISGTITNSNMPFLDALLEKGTPLTNKAILEVFKTRKISTREAKSILEIAKARYPKTFEFAQSHIEKFDPELASDPDIKYLLKGGIVKRTYTWLKDRLNPFKKAPVEPVETDFEHLAEEPHGI